MLIFWLLLILWPIAELLVAIQVAQAIGVLDDVPPPDHHLADRDVGAADAGPDGLAALHGRGG